MPVQIIYLRNKNMKPIVITFLSALPLVCGCNRESFSETKIDITCFDKTSAFPDGTQIKKAMKSVYIHGQKLLAEPKDLCLEDTLCIFWMPISPCHASV